MADETNYPRIVLGTRPKIKLISQKEIKEIFNKMKRKVGKNNKGKMDRKVKLGLLMGFSMGFMISNGFLRLIADARPGEILQEFLDLIFLLFVAGALGIFYTYLITRYSIADNFKTNSEVK